MKVKESAVAMGNGRRLAISRPLLKESSGRSTEESQASTHVSIIDLILAPGSGVGPARVDG